MDKKLSEKTSYQCRLETKSTLISHETIASCQRIAARRFGGLCQSRETNSVEVKYTVEVSDAMGKLESSGAAPVNVEPLEETTKAVSLTFLFFDHTSSESAMASVNLETGVFSKGMVLVKSQLGSHSRDFAVGFAQDLLKCVEENRTPYHHFSISSPVFMIAWLFFLGVAMLSGFIISGDEQKIIMLTAYFFVFLLVLFHFIFPLVFSSVEFDTRRAPYKRRIRKYALGGALAVLTAAFPVYQYLGQALRNYLFGG